MTGTTIAWTDVTWNPVRGCARVSPGCEHCYAERQAHRFSGSGKPYEGLTVLGNHGPRWAGAARFVPEMLGAPLTWRKPQRVFVDSMSDLFHDDITDAQIAQVWWVMGQCVGLLDPTRYRGHTFQILTKRPERMRQWLSGWCDMDTRRRWIEAFGATFDWASGPRYWPDVLPGVWLGVSCEDQQRTNERVPLLLETPAALRFVSAEPLLGRIDFDSIGPAAAQLDWVIVGGESGPRARACEVDWIRSIVRQCRNAGVPCFVKQLGAHPQIAGVDVQFDEATNSWLAGRLQDKKGGEPSEWPRGLCVREFPRFDADGGVCRVCGCTDEWGCDGGCCWVNAEHTLCSECAEETVS